MLARDMQTLVYNFIEGLGPAHFERVENKENTKELEALGKKEVTYSDYQSKFLSKGNSRQWKHWK